MGSNMGSIKIIFARNKIIHFGKLIHHHHDRIIAPKLFLKVPIQNPCSI
jgi:hypothetical protein